MLELVQLIAGSDWTLILMLLVKDFEGCGLPDCGLFASDDAS